MFANLSVFAVITIIALRAQRFTLEEYNGLYSTNPKLAFLMTLALFSLAGIPPSAGFFSKFFIFAAAFQGGFHLLVFIALVNTIISLYYYLKIVKSMYINKSDEPIATFRSDNYTRASLVHRYARYYCIEPCERGLSVHRQVLVRTELVTSYKSYELQVTSGCAITPQSTCNS